MPYLPSARPADKRLLVWWIVAVSCHQGTKCSAGLAPPPRFLVVSLSIYQPCSVFGRFGSFWRARAIIFWPRSRSPAFR